MLIERYTIARRNEIFLMAVERKDRFLLSYLRTLKNPQRIVTLSSQADIARYGLNTNDPRDLIILEANAMQVVAKMLTEAAQAGKDTGYIFNIDYSGYLEAYKKTKAVFDEI